MSSFFIGLFIRPPACAEKAPYEQVVERQKRVLRAKVYQRDELSRANKVHAAFRDLHHVLGLSGAKRAWKSRRFWR